MTIFSLRGHFCISGALGENMHAHTHIHTLTYTRMEYLNRQFLKMEINTMGSYETIKYL